MSLMQRAMRGHIKKIKRYGRVACTYRGIDGISISLIMAPALRTTESTTDDNVLVDVQRHDWLCAVTDLPRKPRRGDVITPLNWGVSFRVVHPGGGREYDYMDPWGRGYRIHTILIDTVGAVEPPPVDPPPVDPPPAIEVVAPYAPPGTNAYYGNHLGEAYAPPQ